MKVSGSVDNLADDEAHAFALIRGFLSYLPDNVWEMPPRGDTSDESAAPRRDAAVADTAQSAADLRSEAADPAASSTSDSFFEIAPLYGRSRVTGLARLNGYPVGVMANNPKHHGGATDVAAGNKVMRLIQLCNTFHLPLISFADEPGFMVGLESEKHGIERAGARLVAMTNQSWMPWSTVVVGRLYGVAGQCHHRPSGMFRRYAWPSANWGSMHIAGGASAAYRREIESAPDPEQARAEIEARLRAHCVAVPHRRGDRPGHHRSARDARAAVRIR